MRLPSAGYHTENGGQVRGERAGCGVGLLYLRGRNTTCVYFERLCVALGDISAGHQTSALQRKSGGVR